MAVGIYNDDKRQKSVSDLSPSPLLGGSGGTENGTYGQLPPPLSQAGTPIMFGGHLPSVQRPQLQVSCHISKDQAGTEYGRAGILWRT